VPAARHSLPGEELKQRGEWSMAHRAAVKKFWAWFVNNSDRLAKKDIASKVGLLDTVQDELHDIDEGLYFELSEPQDGVSEFIITAEGKRELFSVVEAVIAAAPRVAGWQFTALIPPMGFEFVIDYGGIKLDPNGLWFMPLTEGANDQHLGLRIGVPKLTSRKMHATLDATWVLLETGLGERQAAEAIEHVEVVRLPRDPEGEGYLRLAELPGFLTWRESKRKPKGKRPPR
jgi:hypothetical protein